MTKHLADITGEGCCSPAAPGRSSFRSPTRRSGRGVAEHSSFAQDPLLRLRNTLTYIHVVASGTPEEIDRVARAVQGAHTPVRAARYDASDPALQLWVAATLYDTATLLYQQVFGALAPEDAEAVYQDYAALATVLGMPRELWPADRAAFRAYWNDCDYPPDRRPADAGCRARVAASAAGAAVVANEHAARASGDGGPADR